MKVFTYIGFALSLSGCASIQSWDEAYKEKERTETAAYLKNYAQKYVIAQQTMGDPQPMSHFEIQPIPGSLDHIKFFAYAPDGSALFDGIEAICERYAYWQGLRCTQPGTGHVIILTELKNLEYVSNGDLERYKYFFKIMRNGSLWTQHIYYANLAN